MSSTHTVELDQIVVQQRHRRDLGDLKSLAKSIEDVGLLQPVVLTPESLLIAGERRLAAVRMLGWFDIPAFYVSTVSDAASLLRAERDENTCRKPLTPTEEHSLYEAILALEQPKAQERKKELSGRPPKGSVKETRENFSGVSGRARAAAAEAATGKAGRFATLDKVGAVKDIAADESKPEGVRATARKALEQMDATGKVDGAYKRAVRADKTQIERKISEAVWKDSESASVSQDDFRASSVASESIDLILTDPPYGKDALDLYGALAEFAADALKPGRLLACMVGQSYLPEVLRLLGEKLEYHWCCAYLTPGGQSAQLWQRKVNTFWKPVVLFSKGEYRGEWFADVAKSETNDNDKRFHFWGQSESGMFDLVKRLSVAGELVCDPMMGAGTTGVAALASGRRFLGIEQEKDHCDKAKARLAEVLKGLA